ncbi:hypothetical protein AQV86_00975 [Nanohaloarchaea archaeon SG9]|nr:hypothetical protein AQV86_00975 [Nanohaloarchaea archaeon SG9]
MKKDKILITGLIFSGLLLMHQTAGKKPGKVEIQDINQDMVGDKITVSGKIKNLSKRGETQFFRLEDNGEKITALTYNEDLLLYEGLHVKASGKATIHRGKTEFILNRITEKS